MKRGAWIGTDLIVYDMKQTRYIVFTMLTDLIVYDMNQTGYIVFTMLTS